MVLFVSTLIEIDRTTSLAVTHGWQTHDLLHASSYRIFHDAKNRSLEHVTHNGELLVQA